MSTGLKIAVCAFVGVAVVAVLFTAVKAKRGARSFFISALQGVAAMFAVNLTGLVTGVTVAVNWYSLGAAVLCGLPGIVAMLVLDYMFT